MNKILVIGDSCLDEYIYCTTDRFCPDAPVPILKPESFVSALGMAGNVVDNSKSISSNDFLAIKKTRYVDSRTNHMFIRVDEGEDDVFPIAKKSLEDIDFDEFDAVIISDYCKGFIDEDTIKYISKQHSLTFLDTKKTLGDYVDNISFIKINDVEYKYNEGNISSYWSQKMIITRGSRGAEYKGKIYQVE